MIKLPLTVSNSEIQTFKDCRRKWWLAYYREIGLKRPEEVGPRALGTKVHIALDALYSRGDNAMTVLNDLYEEDSRRILSASEGANDDTLRKEQSLAQAMIEGFLDWREEQGIDRSMELVSVETVVEVPLFGLEDQVHLRGKMDQRWMRKTDGARVFRDWKTVQALTEMERILPMDEQMKFYHLLEFLEALDTTGKEPQWRTDGALYTMLRKVKRTATAKPPFYGQIEVHHNIEELRSLMMSVATVCREILAAYEKLDAGQDHRSVVPPRPSRDCTWKCDFFAVCNMFNDGSNAEGMLAEHYQHLDPHLRYAETKGEDTV